MGASGRDVDRPRPGTPRSPRLRAKLGAPIKGGHRPRRRREPAGPAPQGRVPLARRPPPREVRPAHRPGGARRAAGRDGHDRHPGRLGRAIDCASAGMPSARLGWCGRQRVDQAPLVGPGGGWVRPSLRSMSRRFMSSMTARAFSPTYYPGKEDSHVGRAVLPDSARSGPIRPRRAGLPDLLRVRSDAIRPHRAGLPDGLRDRSEVGRAVLPDPVRSGPVRSGPVP